MTFFTASIETVALRFFLMMAVIIGSFFAGVPYLAILGLPIFISAIAAVSFSSKKDKPRPHANIKPKKSSMSQAA